MYLLVWKIMTSISISSYSLLCFQAYKMVICPPVIAEVLIWFTHTVSKDTTQVCKTSKIYFNIIGKVDI